MSRYFEESGRDKVSSMANKARIWIQSKTGWDFLKKDDYGNVKIALYLAFIRRTDKSIWRDTGYIPSIQTVHGMSRDGLGRCCRLSEVSTNITDLLIFICQCFFPQQPSWSSSDELGSHLEKWSQTLGGRDICETRPAADTAILSRCFLVLHCLLKQFNSSKFQIAT